MKNKLINLCEFFSRKDIIILRDNSKNDISLEEDLKAQLEPLKGKLWSVEWDNSDKYKTRVVLEYMK
jgi:hypothetical protein